MFAYCLNNPVNHIDPHGDLVLIDDLAVIGIAAVAAVAVLLVPPPPVNITAPPVFERLVDAITLPIKVGAVILEAKTKGKENILDTGLSHLSDEEIAARARDKTRSKAERKRYQKEEKARGQRNVRKRNDLFLFIVLLR